MASPSSCLGTKERRITCASLTLLHIVVAPESQVMIQFWLVHTALFLLFAILYLSSVKPNKSKTLSKGCQKQMFEFSQYVQIDRWSLSPQAIFAPFRLLVNFSLINALLSRALALRLVFMAFRPKKQGCVQGMNPDIYSSKQVLMSLSGSCNST